MIHTWARSRYLLHLPNPPRVLKTQTGADDSDDMFSFLGDAEYAQAAEDESSDSEGSVGPPTMVRDQESEEDGAVVLAATHRGKEWFYAWRRGGRGNVNTCLAALGPTPCCIVRPLLMASRVVVDGLSCHTMRRRYGLGRCNMLVFLTQD